ncbi:MAG: hypothetical protein ABSE85_10120 [Candidatus Korobacteraceae bacterium]
MDADLLRYLEGMEKRQREYLDQRMQGLREYIDERTHDSETRIVRAFGAYQESAGGSYGVPGGTRQVFSADPALKRWA